MNNIIEKLKSKNNFCFLEAATEEDIRLAEQKLGLTFANDYREYLLSFGVASFQGHELTGIVKSPRLNVVEQTIAEKEVNQNVFDDLYLIETTNIDGIIIWQKNTGEIFKTVFDGVPILICESLSNYIDLCQ